MAKVNIHDARTHLSPYVEQAEQGELVIICRHNKPVVELRLLPLETPVVRQAGLLKGLASWTAGALAPMTDEEVAEFDSSPVFPGNPVS